MIKFGKQCFRNFRMHRFIIIFTISALIMLHSKLTLPAYAQSVAPVVVELFTSQGCSSCPPADELLSKLAQEKGIIALGMHVDYWDYIGWRDPFAQPIMTLRQKEYARTLNQPFIYTPQMVINGRYQAVGSKKLMVENLIETARTHYPLVEISPQWDGDDVYVSLPAMAAVAKGYNLFFAQITPFSSTKVTAGENNGRELKDSNIVLKLDNIGYWDGTATEFRKKIEIKSTMSALIIQTAEFGPIVGAGFVE